MYFYPFAARLLVQQQRSSYSFMRLPLTVYRHRAAPRGHRGTSATCKNTFDVVVRVCVPAIPRGRPPAGSAGAARDCGRCRPAPGLGGPRSGAERGGRRSRRAAHSGAASPLRSAPRTRLAADFPPASPLRREKTLTRPSSGSFRPRSPPASRGTSRRGDAASARAPGEGSRRGRGGPRSAQGSLQALPGGPSRRPLPRGLHGSPAARRPAGGPAAATPSPSPAAPPRPAPIPATATATLPALPLPAGRDGGDLNTSIAPALALILARGWCLSSTLRPPHAGGTWTCPPEKCAIPLSPTPPHPPPRLGPAPPAALGRGPASERRPVPRDPPPARGGRLRAAGRAGRAIRLRRNALLNFEYISWHQCELGLPAPSSLLLPYLLLLRLLPLLPPVSDGKSWSRADRSLLEETAERRGGLRSQLRPRRGDAARRRSHGPRRRSLSAALGRAAAPLPCSPRAEPSPAEPSRAAPSRGCPRSCGSRSAMCRWAPHREPGGHPVSAARRRAGGRAAGPAAGRGRANFPTWRGAGASGLRWDGGPGEVGRAGLLPGSAAPGAALRRPARGSAAGWWRGRGHPAGRGCVFVHGARCAVLLPPAGCWAKRAFLVAVFAVRQRWRGR